MSKDITFRGGLRPNDPSKPRLLLARALTGGPVPAPPATEDWDTKVSSFGMLGNDSWGDCDEAMKLHALQTWTANAGTELVPTEQDALTAYSEITGFDPKAGPPGENPTDQGTVMQDALNFWRTKGLLVGGQRHQIVAFAQVNHTNLQEMRDAVALFGELLVGLAFPDSAMEQFNAGEAWDVVPGAPKPTEGHAVCSARYDAATGDWWFITWGREQRATAAFVRKYVSEAWVAVSQEWLDKTGQTPTGLHWPTLQGDFALLTGETLPDLPPAPIPTPVPQPTLDDAGHQLAAWLLSHEGQEWLSRHHVGANGSAATALRTWAKAEGVLP
jgi:hypothetical protein